VSFNLIAMPSTLAANGSPPTLSTLGLAAMAVGLSIVGFEVAVGLVRERLGMTGHVVVIGCGIYFSVWGLKEVIAGLWPSLGQTGLGRDRFRFPGEGLAYVGIMAVVFIGSMIGRSNPLLLVFSLMAGPLVVNGWMTKTLVHRVAPRRRVPERVMAGEPTSIDVGIQNDKAWLSAWLLTVVDRVSNDRETLQPMVVFPRVPPGGTSSGQYRLRLAQRGVYSFGPLQVNTRFPLGLVERGVNFELPDRVLVYPRLGRLAAGWKDQLRQATELVSRQPRGGSFHDEFHKLREYRRGDDMRAIHWKTSARQNELMVREFRQNRDQDVVILLDAWQPAAPSEADRIAAERAISLAASVAVDQCRQGRESIPFVAAGGAEQFTWGGTTGSHRIETLLDGLALLQPAPDVDLPRLLEACNAHLTSRRRLLLATSRRDDVRQLAERWAAERAAERGRLPRLLDVVDARDPRCERLIVWS